MGWIDVHPTNLVLTNTSSPYPGIIVGADPWNDDNTATYTMTTETGNTNVGVRGDIPQQSLVGVTKFELVGDWSSDSNPDLVGPLQRGSVELSIGGIQQVAFAPTGTNETVLIPTDGGLRQAVTVTDVQSSNTGEFGALDELVATVNSPNVKILVRPLMTFGTPLGTLHRLWTHELVLRFWIGDPVLRQIHRRDGLGQASVGRLTPGTNSVTRVIGGQP